jgi:hypothetical protein
MGGQATEAPGQLTAYPNVKYVFYGLAALVSLIAVGHLYVIQGATDIYLGLPLWVWLQNAIFAVMIVIAWIAVRLRAMAIEGGA